MRSLRDMNTIHVEITNACDLECSNCTRFVGHHRKPFFMDVETVEKALRSLEGFRGNIGIMGGEPTIHPRFLDICRLVQKLVPNKEQRALWTNGLKYQEYKDVIEETFLIDKIIYNDHRLHYFGWFRLLLNTLGNSIDVIPTGHNIVLLKNY